MPSERLSFRELTRGLWLKGPKENTPGGYVRRAKSIFPPRGGSILSRSGCVNLCSQNAHSIFKFNAQRIIGVGTSLLRFDGGPFPAAASTITMPTGVTLSGTRLNFMEIPSQFLATNPNLDPDTLLPGSFAETDFLFVSSTTGDFVPFKVDVSFAATKWGISAPTSAQLPNTVTVNAQTTKDIDTLQAAAGWTQYGGVGALTVSARSATGGTSLRVRNARDTATSGEAIIVKSITTDLTTFGATASSDEDYIGVWVHLNRPAHTQKLKMALYVGPGPFLPGTFADPNTDPPPESPYTDFYSFECVVKVVKKPQVKVLRGLGDSLPFDSAKQRKYLKRHPASSGVDLSQQQFTADGQLEVTNNTWTHLLVPKSQFSKNGRAGNVGYTFAAVIGVELSIENNAKGKGAVWWDHLQLLGGAGMKGDYLYTITFRNDGTGSRSNPPIDTTLKADTNPNFGQIQTVAASHVDRQSVALSFVTLTEAAINAVDSQITHVELWRNIGNGGPSAFFKQGQYAKASFNGAFTITDTTADYVGMFTTGVVNVLNPDELLTTDNSPPVSTLGQAVYHAPSGRVFALDFATANRNRVLYGPPGRPESLGNGGFIEPSTPDDPVQRLVMWGDRLYVLTQKRLFLVEGTDEPFVSFEAIGTPGTTQPLTVQSTPGGIVYQARDGVRLFNGTTSELIADDVLAQVFRGSTVETIPAFTGVLASYGRDEYVISNTTDTTLALNMRDGAWRNIGLPVSALYHEKDTSICLASAPVLSLATGVLVISPTSVLSITTALPFLSLASTTLATFATAAPAQARMPAAATFTAMYVTLSVAPGGTGITFQFNVNGSTSSAIVVTIGAAGTTGSATGSLVLAQDDLVCIETSGASTTASLRNISIAYTVTI